MNSLTIWKFPLSPTQVDLQLPKGAKILSVGVQQEEPMLWVLVNPDAPKARRRIRIYGTGHPVPPSTLDVFEFVGTFQLPQLVFHVFVEKVDSP